MDKVKKESKKDGLLVGKEKWIVLLTVLLSPMLAGAVYYYGWAKKLPIKAKQANKYSYIAFGVLVCIYAARFLLR